MKTKQNPKKFKGGGAVSYGEFARCYDLENNHIFRLMRCST